MSSFVDHPGTLFVALLALLIASVAFGAFYLRRIAVLSDDERESFNLIQTATLTLLALIIGFSLSMAVGRYDQRKNLEEGEANAIGTEYARADLTDAALGASMKDELVRYTRLRIEDYLRREPAHADRIARETAARQANLWRLATQAANDHPTPIAALVVAGMNDVLNSQDYSEAARINRIPLGAWALMIVIAMFGCMIQGYGVKGRGRMRLLVTILPVIVSLSLTLIADIDSPRGGIIRLQPQNLARLLQSLEK